MGSVGGLLGVSGGQGGTGFSTLAGANAGQLNQAYQGQQNAMQSQQGLLSALQAQNGLQNQSNVYNQEQGIVNGQGPNPAAAQLAQSTGANVANQAALMAGQRGAGANVGLMARQAAQQGGALQQQAAGQGATMQAQQSLNALGQAGEMAGTMANNQIGQTNANVAAQQNEQGILQGANNANNAIQGQLANTTLGGQQATLGGIAQGVGTAAHLMAAGGPVAHYAYGSDDIGTFSSAPKSDSSGGGLGPMAMMMAGGGQAGAFGPQSMFAQNMSGQNASQPMPTFSQSSGASALQKGIASMGKPADPNSRSAQNKNIGNDSKQVLGSSPEMMQDPTMNGAAGGGKVPAMVSPGERFLKPYEAKAVAQGKADPMKVGEKIPGQAKVKGDSYANDTVRKNLDVGGIVLPKSITESKNPGMEARKFVTAYLSKKGKK